jgi:hypothetical protein
MLEIGRRLSILKAARELFTLNFYRDVGALLERNHNGIAGIASELGASFATQGFQLLDLEVGEGGVRALVLDTVPKLNEMRPFHCSQFLVPIAIRFPGKDVAVVYARDGTSEALVFSASSEVLTRASDAPDPLAVLAENLKMERTEFELPRPNSPGGVRGRDGRDS